MSLSELRLWNFREYGKGKAVQATLFYIGHDYFGGLPGIATRFRILATQRLKE